MWSLLAAVALGAFGLAAVLLMLLIVGGASVIAGVLSGPGWPSHDAGRPVPGPEVRR